MPTIPQPPDRVLAQFAANARAAVQKFNAEFAAWQHNDTDTIKAPDMMVYAVEFAAYLDNILDRLGDSDAD